MDATSCSDEALTEGALGFLDASGGPLSFRKASGGMNNRVYYVAQGDATFVIRVYNNGGNGARVAYEHRILLELERRFVAFFELPRLLRSHRGTTAVAVSCMEPGTEACMFRVIRGQTAAVTSAATAASAGEATAVLVGAMLGLDLSSVPCPNPRFRDVFAACPGRLLTAAEVAAVMGGPEFDAVRDDTSYLLRELGRVHAAAAAAKQLPEQQIHADAHLDNFLVGDDERVSAILDFEFSAFDWRVMEAAVGLTKYIATAGIDIELMVQRYLEGYARAGSLTAAECDFLPDGMALRVLSNVVFFVGRAVSDPPQVRAAIVFSAPSSRCCFLRSWI